jgi:aspartate/methionine/tyrosine aminotransferase
MASCHARVVATDANYQLQPEAIHEAITSRTRAIVTISPNNPSGAVYSQAALEKVNGICREHRLYHIHDEAYEYFTYGDARNFSPGSLPGSEQHTISLYSLSKAFGFASWRIGYMVVPDHLIQAVNKIQDTLLICAPVISQYAALGAFAAGKAYCRGHLRQIASVRKQVLSSLEQLADICEVPRADGAFYFLVRLKSQLDPLTVVQQLIRNHKVAAIPGSAFGLHEGCYLRLAYGSLAPENATVALDRFVDGIRAITGSESLRPASG